MIRSFGDELTDNIFNGLSDRTTRRMDRELLRQIKRRLDVLNAAKRIEDLMLTPSNRFHSLSGNLEGYYAVSVNNQWRIVFSWENNEAHNVVLKDYH